MSRSWLPDSSDIFVSVGADGSLRAFDLRTLEHSTILYESAADTPLARISFSNREQYVPFLLLFSSLTSSPGRLRNRADPQTHASMLWNG
jgi:WD40 repeat protein